MKKLFTLLALASILNMQAQTWVTIPDANFVTYLQSLIPAAMHGDSLDISSTLVTTTTQTINVSGNSIADLTGIQYFTALVSLDCSSNSLTSLPSLPNKIYNLFCGYNSLTSLPATLPDSLRFFNCTHNYSLPGISSLPNALTHLDCSINNMATLPALPNSLIYINCQYAALTSLPALPHSLQSLYCEHNSLTSLPLLPNTLQTLYCNYNNISCFPPFPSSIGVFSLEIDNNPYDCLPNYIPAMGSDTVSFPKCAAGNTHGCAIAAGIHQTGNIEHNIIVYPNPSKGIFQITSSHLLLTDIKVYDVNGRLVLTRSIESKTSVDASSLPNGVYNVSITSNEGIVNKRVVINH